MTPITTVPSSRVSPSDLFGSGANIFQRPEANPSEMVGAAAPVLPAFFAIQSRAARMLSSVPALSWQTVIENPPSAVRATETIRVTPTAM